VVRLAEIEVPEESLPLLARVILRAESLGISPETAIMQAMKLWTELREKREYAGTMPTIDLQNPRPAIHPDALPKIAEELKKAGFMRIEDPALATRYAASLINRLIKEGHRPLTTANISVHLSEDPVSALVAVDHQACEGREPLVVLYLGEREACSVSLEMRAKEFRDLAAFMGRAAATGLPASLRFGQDGPPYLLDPYNGTRTPLAATDPPGEAGPAQSGS
jgi:hypothetical protein